MKQGNLVHGFDYEDGHHKPLTVSKRTPETTHAEDKHQEALYDWIRAHKSRAPELARFRHIPNGGLRGERYTATRRDGRSYTYNPVGLALKRQGVLPGTLDNFNPVARRGYCGLWIELKVNDGKLSQDPKAEWDQARERAALIAEGHCVHVAWSWAEAARIAVWYFGLEGIIAAPGRHAALSPKKGHNERCGCALKI